MFILNNMHSPVLNLTKQMFYDVVVLCNHQGATLTNKCVWPPLPSSLPLLQIKFHHDED